MDPASLRLSDAPRTPDGRHWDDDDVVHSTHVKKDEASPAGFALSPGTHLVLRSDPSEVPHFSAIKADKVREMQAICRHQSSLSTPDGAG